MSETLRTVTPGQCASVPAPATRPERRQMRRAGISLQVRIRTADFNEGNFEEVQVTQNASRKALYFFTKVDRYYKGMRVRVTCPYDQNAGTTNLEQIGEVARVHRREDGFGVAIAILSGVTPTNKQPEACAAAMSSSAQRTERASTAPTDRRSATRLPFIAPVELVEMQTGSRIRARTSDLSRQGCYVDTLNPLPVGAAVRVQIHRAGMVLDVLANVSSRHVGSGMGLVFGEVSREQTAILESWLDDLGFPSRVLIDAPFSVTSPPSSVQNDRATRLVQVLLRKGLLNQAEVREILNDSTSEGVHRSPASYNSF